MQRFVNIIGLLTIVVLMILGINSLLPKGESVSLPSSSQSQTGQGLDPREAGWHTTGRDKLIHALIQVESGGHDEAIGDGGKAIGCLQIWRPYWYDAIERSGIGGTYQDCFDRDYSLSIIDAYMRRYAGTEWAILNDPNCDGDTLLYAMEYVSRIHNGGPKGYTKESTEPYWAKVAAELQMSVK